MSGVQGHVVGHLVRRGVQHFSSVSPDYMQELRNDAELYEKSGPEMEVNPAEFLPLVITAILIILISASVSWFFFDNKS